MKWSASRFVAQFVIALGLLLAVSFGAGGASAEDFYRNKQLRLIVGFPAGNDYDLGARFLVKDLTKYIPPPLAATVKALLPNLK